MIDLIERLRNEAPKVGESENVWCSIHASDLREAADTIEALTAERDALLLAEEAAKNAFEHLVREKHEVARSEASLRRSLEILLVQNRTLQAEREAALAAALTEAKAAVDRAWPC